MTDAPKVEPVILVPKLITDWRSFVDALVDRRHELGWTVEVLGERAGLTPGYVTKLENFDGPQGRVASAVSLPLWMEALGVRFVRVTQAPAETVRAALRDAETARRPRRGDP